MPVMQMYSPRPEPPAGMLEQICNDVMSILGLPADHAWAIWNAIPSQNYFRPNWAEARENGGPVVIIHCKNTYSQAQLEQIMRSVQGTMAERLSCKPESVYIAFQRISPGEVLVRNNIWRGDVT